MSTESRIKVQSLSKGTVSYLRLYGVVDETFDPREVLNAVTGRDVIINAKAITRISSFGVREWVRAMEAVAKHADRITLVQCSPALVAQLNMIGNLAAHTRVASIQVPYFCESCSWDTSVTCVLDHPIGSDASDLPPVKCKRCGGVMVIDDVVENYFAFQKNANLEQADPALLAFIRDFAGAMDAAEPLDAAPAAPVADTPTDPTPPPGVSTPPTPPVAVTERRKSRSVRVWMIACVALIVVPLAMTWLVRSRSVPTPPAVPPTPAPGAAVEPVAVSQTVPTVDRDTAAAAPTVAGSLECRRAVESFQANRFAEAVAAANRALAQGPLDADALFAMAESLRQLGKAGDAYRRYREFTDQFPKDGRLDTALFWQAEQLLRTNDKAAAAALYKRIVNDFPTSAFRRKAQKRADGMHRTAAH